MSSDHNRNSTRFGKISSKLPEKRQTGLNFYRRKGSAYLAMNSTTLFFLWVVIMLLALETLRLALIFLGGVSSIGTQLHMWKSHYLFGLDMMGCCQMLGLLLAGYVLAHLGVFLTEPHRSKQNLIIGVAVHIFGIVTALLYVVAYGTYGQFLESLKWI